MPEYTLLNKKTKKTKVMTMTIAEGDRYEKAHPDWERMCGAPGFGDSWRMGRLKPSEVFRDRLRTIKKTRPKNTINVL
jgi:hypothetical protein